MRQTYIESVTYPEPATAVHYCYGKLIRPGYILEIKNVIFGQDNSKTNELLSFRIDFGKNEFIIKDTIPDLNGVYAYWQGRLAIGEGMRPCVYVPDSANGDTLRIDVFGFLYDKDCWQLKDS